MWVIILVIILLLIVSLAIYTSFTRKKSQKTFSKRASKGAAEEQNVKSHRKGELGEYKINFQLEQLSHEFRYIGDILISKNKGFTQIDHVLITPVGLFVIETKNYVGKIYGSPKYNYWNQYINGSKNSFYSPIKQNEGHIKALKVLLKSYGDIEYHSVISFTRRCELKIDLDLRTAESDTMVVYDTNLSDSILKKYHILKKNNKQLLNENEISKIYDTLSSANITDVTARREHIESVKRINSN
ncbi:nuclease-related domain-containing protein [Clostridium sp.]|uniref:nuclease-related domain-containing protein n=1 Tax=Clostridium sp. TaxID=1506 RepID=UPI002FC7DA1C